MSYLTNSAGVDLSLIVPFLNEAASIGRMLKSLRCQELNGTTVEILFADGGSTDSSARLIESTAGKLPSGMTVRIFANPERSTTAGFNRGISLARGGAIGIGGSRTVYPPHFFATANGLLKETTAALVGGGVSSIIPTNDGVVARAIAGMYRSRVGTAVANYRRRTESGTADTVYCGFYRREVFERLGGFDQSLARGQDNEFNSRLCQSGFRIYFHPFLSTAYQVRGGVRALLRRGWMSGRAVVAGWRVNRRAFRWHHSVPLVWVSFLIFGAVFAVGLPALHVLYLVGLGAYCAVLVVASAAMIRVDGFRVALVAIPIFAIYHIAYGVGSLRELLVSLRSHRRGDAT